MRQNFTTTTKPIETNGAEWEYYYCEIDNHPSVISVDLDMAHRAPVTRLPQMFFLSVKLNDKTTEGLPAPSELHSLCRLEDALLAHFAGRASHFVGRITTNGCRDLVFYTSNPLALTRLTKEVMSLFPQYGFETGFKSDFEWDFYFTFLFPSEKELNSILNQRLIGRLEAKGALEAEVKYAVDHRLFFTDEESRDKFILQAIDTYFKVEQIGLCGDNPEHPWLLSVSRPEPMELEYINQLTLDMMHSSRQCSGIYDGWEVQSS